MATSINYDFSFIILVINPVSDAFQFHLTCLAHIHSVTMHASLPREHNQPNQNALQKINNLTEKKS